MTDSDAVVIDPKAHARLTEWGGEELVTQMIRLFLENAPTRLEQVRNGLSEGGLAEAERGVHSLKSSAANVGAVAVSRIANEMEERASDGDTVALEALLPDQRLRSPRLGSNSRPPSQERRRENEEDPSR